MTYTIDEKICNKKGLDLPSVLAIMLVKTGVNITSLFDELLKKEILVRDLFSSGFFIYVLENLLNAGILYYDNHLLHLGELFTYILDNGVSHNLLPIQQIFSSNL